MANAPVNYLFKESLFTHVYLCRIISLEMEFVSKPLCFYDFNKICQILSSLKVEPVYNSQNSI